MSQKKFQAYPMLMSPYICPRPWGGRRLHDVLSKPEPAEGGPFGESWELADHPNGKSTIANGAYAGELFGDLLRREPVGMVAGEAVLDRFPLLIKYIDAEENLSIQIHPNDEQAVKIGDRGKTECWYVMDCEPGAELIHGLKPDATVETLREGTKDGSIEDQLRRLPIKPHTFVNVPAGTVHAIMGGTMICEIQQSSDTTWRLWDWNRKPARTIHVEDSLDVMNFDLSAQKDPVDLADMASGDWRELVCNEYFKVWALRLADGESAKPATSNEHGMIINVTGGRGTIEIDGQAPMGVKTGETIFIPAALGSDWRLVGSESEGSSNEDFRVLLSRSEEI